jgi:hypothetical protein
MADYNPSRRARTKGKSVSSEREHVNPNPRNSIDYTRPLEDEAWATARKANADNHFMHDVSLIYIELEELLLSKHKDYGPKNIADAPGGALNGLRVRIHDKMARINHLIDNNQEARHEPLEDSFKDLANYAIIALLVLRGKWDK